MELQGTVKKIFDTQTFASGFQKREMVLLTQERLLQLQQTKILSQTKVMTIYLSKIIEILYI